MVPQVTHDDPRRGFLDRFAHPQRSTVANTFLCAIRAGATTAPEVCRRVAGVYIVRQAAGERYRDAIAQQQARAVLDVLAEHPDEAADFAAWCLEWESLPTSERTRLKGRRGDEHRRRWLSEQPPTARQVAYARLLGYEGPITSKADASRIIDSLKAGAVV